MVVKRVETTIKTTLVYTPAEEESRFEEVCDPILPLVPVAPAPPSEVVSDPILPLIPPLPVTSEAVSDHILHLVPEVPAPTSGPPKIKVPEAFNRGVQTVKILDIRLALRVFPLHVISGGTTKNFRSLA